MVVHNVLVVGGGLAGLSAAIALARHSVAVTVATLEDRAGGTSITITNRAVDAVEALGVLDACLAGGLYPSGPTSIFSAMMDRAGNPLPVPPPPPRPDTRLPGWIAIYRPDLSHILNDAAEAAGVTIRSDTFTALTDEGSHVAAALTDGTHARFDLVVGADGSYYAVRRLIHPDLAPAYTGPMSFRLLLENGPEGPAGFHAPPSGSGQLATVRLPGNRLYLAAGKRMDNRRLDQAEALTLLDEVLTPYTAPLIRCIRARLAGNPPVIARPFEYLLVPAPFAPRPHRHHRRRRPRHHPEPRVGRQHRAGGWRRAGRGTGKGRLARHRSRRLLGPPLPPLRHGRRDQPSDHAPHRHRPGRQRGAARAGARGVDEALLSRVGRRQ